MNDIARMPASVGYELLIHYRDQGSPEPVELPGATEEGAAAEATHLYSPRFMERIEWYPLSPDLEGAAPWPSGWVGSARRVA